MILSFELIKGIQVVKLRKANSVLFFLRSRTLIKSVLDSTFDIQDEIYLT